MNRHRSLEHSGTAGRAEEPRRTAVVEAACNLVRTKGAVAFMAQDKAMAWANLQIAVDALETAR